MALRLGRNMAQHGVAAWPQHGTTWRCGLAATWRNMAWL
jgi:hypothetical protein